MAIKVFDFFSGCGGASVGFREAGMEIVLGIDNEKNAAQTFMANFPEANFIRKDIQKLDVSDIAEYIGLCKPEDRILFNGCAPCQPFSRQKKNRDLKDNRIPLLKEFARFVEYYKPDFIFVENVPGIRKLSTGINPFTHFLALLEKLKYEYKFNIIEAKYYGIPQWRRRLVLVASLLGEIEFPSNTHGKGKLPYSTAWEWIKDLPPLEAGECDPNDRAHQAANLSEINLERIRNTPIGGSRLDWPEHLWLDCHKKEYKGHTDVYGRIRKDELATSMTTRCIILSSGRFGHPEQNRAISAREAACLQTFPRDFQFHGKLQSIARQIGNAVPPLLAKTFGQQFIHHSKNYQASLFNLSYSSSISSKKNPNG